MEKKTVILGGARTPMAEWVGGKAGSDERGGKFNDVSAIDLGAASAKAALERTGVPADRIEHVIMGPRCRPAATQSTARGTSGSRLVCRKAYPH